MPCRRLGDHDVARLGVNTVYPVKTSSALDIRGLRLLAAGLLCSSAIWVGQTARADGAFLQLDLSQSTSNATMSIARGPLTFGAGAVDYDGGRAYRVSATYKLPFGQDVATVKVGPSVGLVVADDAEDTVDLGLNLVAERYIPTDFGSVFLLADFDTNESAWFVLAQGTNARFGLSVELSHGESDNYAETSIALAKRLSDSPVSLRLGYRLKANEIFAGVSINTF